MVVTQPSSHLSTGDSSTTNCSSGKIWNAAETCENLEFSEFERYFIGPRDLQHHSKWPIFLQLHGSVVPLLVLPLSVVGLWATLVSCISILWHRIGIDHVLLTVLGFVVGLSLSFRSSTAYERYNDGRRYWGQLSVATQSLARLVWVHAEEREDFASEDLLAKVTFCNMLVTFAIALKHRLRFEPFTDYDDLRSRATHLSVLAHNAERRYWKAPSAWKLTGLMLGLPMAESNPRKLIKDPERPLGNVPLEILSFCSIYVKSIIDNGTMKTAAYHTQAMTLLTQLNEILTGTDRVLNTPLPVAYSICIAQITWVYIIILPFQLVNVLEWATIPVTIFAAYIILGIALIGREIENPFGEDVNDLPLDHFCEQIRQDVDTIMCQGPSTAEEFVHRDENMPLIPLSKHGFNYLKTKTPNDVRELLKARSEFLFIKNKARK